MGLHFRKPLTKSKVDIFGRCEHHHLLFVSWDMAVCFAVELIELDKYHKLKSYTGQWIGLVGKIWKKYGAETSHFPIFYQSIE